MQNLPIANRNFAQLATLVPGAIALSGTAIAGGVQRLGGGGQNNIMMDGVSNMDTGNNGQAIQMNNESISEVKVLSQGYQAEFGRSSGLQISAVTKSGTNRFRGSTYDIERNSDWNSNSWANIQNGLPKAVSKQRDWGYSLGGPVGKAGGNNHLFFFYSHEYRPRTAGGATNLFRVPTALERKGDFSETKDNNGALFNLIRDYSTGLPCTAADTSGCFKDGGVLGQDSAEPVVSHRHEHPEQLLAAAERQGLNCNLQNTKRPDKRLTQQPTVRVDYQWSSKLRIDRRIHGQLADGQAESGEHPASTTRSRNTRSSISRRPRSITRSTRRRSSRARGASSRTSSDRRSSARRRTSATSGSAICPCFLPRMQKP